MKTAILKMKNINAFYHNEQKPVLFDISFSIDHGERVAIFGLNGSGKTTLLLTIVGFLKYTGEIYYEDSLICDRNIGDFRKKVGFLFSIPDDQLLFPSVLEDISFSAKVRGVSQTEADKRVKDIVSMLGIEQYLNSYTFELSHGERLKVALGGILAGNPELLLLDEPSSGLDPVAKRRLVDILERLDSSQLIATHDIDFAASFCKRYILLEKGKLIKEGSDFNEVRKYWETFNS